MVKYEVKLARLERLAGKESCPACRPLRPNVWPDLERHGQPADPGSFVIRVCDMCGVRRTFSLAPYDPVLRPMVRLFFEATAEDTFTDPRAWAARKWIVLFAGAMRERKEVRQLASLLDELMPSVGNFSVEPLRELERKQRPRVNMRPLLELERHVTLNPVYKRLRARHGDNPFLDLAARMKATKAPDYCGMGKDEQFAIYVSPKMMSALEREAGLRLKCAEAERVALGDVQPYTAQALAECEQRALKTVAQARQRYEEEEAKRRLKEEEQGGGNRALHEDNLPVQNGTNPAGPRGFSEKDPAVFDRPAKDPQALPEGNPAIPPSGTLASQQRRGPDTLAGGYDPAPAPPQDYQRAVTAAQRIKEEWLKKRISTRSRLDTLGRNYRRST